MEASKKYFLNNYHINDIKQLCDDIYYFRRNIKEYIDTIISSGIDEFLTLSLGSMIEKIEDFNEEVFLYTQYIRCYEDTDKIIYDTKKFCVEIVIFKNYIERVIDRIKEGVDMKNKYFGYIIMDLNKLLNPLEDLKFVVGDYLDFLKRN